ncbi:hypothetical protein DV113_004039 [Geotrichum candidum]|uniref:DUF866-domain-containing protein n=1 Tax=Geotrichum candidum TaxID=1173061 RepID=A0A0J9X9W3_GEOCN|nr:hypothetical protein DV113_004039 [Geotrichum candidum]CDO54053.1 similar to Saccharomyces cerevisiae YCR090C Putative protein of unknown function [Geotrichum candidum]
MVGLALKTELSGVTDLTFNDTLEDPYLYTFKIACTVCREVHPKEITINLYETNEIPGSKGEANFVFKCGSCGKRSSVNASKPKTSVYTLEDSGKSVRLLDIDSRGIDFVSFIPDGKFKCQGAESNTKFDEVDLEDNEWYDYDEKAGDEVSITNVQWEITKK